MPSLLILTDAGESDLHHAQALRIGEHHCDLVVLGELVRMKVNFGLFFDGFLTFLLEITIHLVARDRLPIPGAGL